MVTTDEDLYCVVNFALFHPLLFAYGACIQVMFEPYLKNFYIRSNDSTHVKLLKVQLCSHNGLSSLYDTSQFQFLFCHFELA